MKILFVLDQLPYPPRNGVTVPTFNYVSRLARQHDVSLLYVKDSSEDLDTGAVAENSRYVDCFWTVNRVHKSKLRRIKDELTLSHPYFLGWKYDTEQVKKNLNGYAFDVVWVSPFAVVDVVESLASLLRPKPIYVAGINDCTTAMLRSSGKRIFLEGLDIGTRAMFAMKWLRGCRFGSMEAKILRNYDLILIQTGVEEMWLGRISKGKLDEKLLVLPNGVNTVLFGIPLGEPGKDILFVGDLSGVYSQVILWLLDKVWPRIRVMQRDTKLFVIGKSPSSTLRRKMLLDDRVVHTEYSADICDVFRQKGVMLAPVFKNYGLINKVIEAMAAGVPVVGDRGCFNGISGFENGTHGIIANDAVSMANSINKLLDSTRLRHNISKAARELVKSLFVWEERISKINTNLVSLLDTRLSKDPGPEDQVF